MLAATTGRLRGDEHVHVGVLAIAHVAHETDLAPVEVQIAEKVRTVEEHPEGRVSIRGNLLRRDRAGSG